MRRILVTGANGQLGCALRLAAAGSGDSWLFTDLADASDETLARLLVQGGPKVDLATMRLDVTDANAVGKMLRDNEIDTVINCAAYTAVDAAESHPAEAHLLNAEAPRILANAVRETGGLLVHISTDYVFDGNHTIPWKETDLPSPLGVYGRTKLEGEIAVAESGCKYMIIRTAWLYSEFGKNFCKTILKLTSERPEIRVVNDQFGTPTYAGDLAETLLRIIPKYSRSGIWHYTNSGQCSWYEFARAIAAEVGHTNCRIDPCATAEYPTAARRPAWSVLDKTRIAEDFGIVPPAWEESLRRCLRYCGA
ncbi:MAG: dTDP-4-dehydrorhamnose reductase [Bacteroidales bacterium]|nr:dTDP-4-dehydrorhamnose reductase [Bacteroidales bacterium]